MPEHKWVSGVFHSAAVEGSVGPKITVDFCSTCGIAAVGLSAAHKLPCPPWSEAWLPSKEAEDMLEEVYVEVLPGRALMRSLRKMLNLIDRKGLK